MGVGRLLFSVLWPMSQGLEFTHGLLSQLPTQKHVFLQFPACDSREATSNKFPRRGLLQLLVPLAHPIQAHP